MNQSKVLLIARTTELFSGLNQLLGAQNIRVCQVENWSQAKASLAIEQPQMIVLDCPGSGVECLAVCQDIRGHYPGLLVLVAEEGDQRFHLLGLGLGADLSLAANAGSLLISANIKALLRRFAPAESPVILTFGRLTIDVDKRDVFVAEQASQLSTIEFNLIWCLGQKAGRVVSRQDIHQALYSTPYNGYDRHIDLYVSRIRQKIGDDPVLPRYLKTVRGVGYQFVGG